MSPNIHALLQNYLPRLQMYARHLTRNAADADDLAQTAALKILAASSHFEQGTDFGAWARTIMRHSHFSDCRKARIRPTTSIDTLPTYAPVHLSLVSRATQEDDVMASEIRRAAKGLNPHLRLTLMLMGENAFSCQEAARAMACSVGTVKSRLWRARMQMKAMLGDDGEPHALAPAA